MESGNLVNTKKNIEALRVACAKGLEEAISDASDASQTDLTAGLISQRATSPGS